nr:MAG TPA: hypothetical protein [Caudoviricetes sp.]
MINSSNNQYNNMATRASDSILLQFLIYIGLLRIFYFIPSHPLP